MSIESPDVIVAEPNEQSTLGIEDVAKKSETTTESAPVEKSTEDQTSAAVPDEDSKDSDSKWIGRRLERAKAAERSKANAEIVAMREEIERLKTSVPTQQQNQQAVTSKPKLADYNDIESYTEAVTDWKLDQKLNQVNAQTAAQKSIETYQSRAKELVKTVPDFEQTVNAFMNDYKEVNIPELTTIAFESEIGPKLVYYLATHESDMERIIELPSHRRLIELGKLEDKLGNAKDVPIAKTKAPAPITPEKGGAGSKKDISDPNLTQAEYRAMRIIQRKGKI